jgi:single-strand DNA-binding protein
MANGINKVILIGNLGRDPEILRMESGIKKASFSLATTEVYKNKEGVKTEHTEWHNIILWRNLAEVAENYLKKGNQVYIEGRIRRREYEDKEGVKKFIYEILGDSMQMLGGAPKHDSGGGTDPQAGNSKPENGNGNGNGDAPVPEDDLPF